MIRVTNNFNLFFDANTPLYIYGIGYAGTYIGEYMCRCNIEFHGYIDKRGNDSNEIYVGQKKVYGLKKIKEYKNKPVRVIIGSYDYGSMLFRLHQIDENDEYNIQCFVPIENEKYDINWMLGFFRGKLVNGEIASFISNDCGASAIYRNIGKLDYITMTPTVETWIEADSFLKIALNPEHYLKVEMKPYGLQVPKYGPKEIWPAGIVDDAVVYFRNANGTNEHVMNKFIDRWNYTKENINWNKMGFLVRIMCHRDSVFDYAKKMQACKYPYRIIYQSQNPGIVLSEDRHVLVSPIDFWDKDRAIEDYGFDFVGWYNDFIDEIEGKR